MSEDQLSRVFAALADPTRRDILARLAVGDATVGQLAAPYNVSILAVSKHLKVLEDAGLVSHSQDAQRRPRHLEAGVFDMMTAWIERYRRQAEERRHPVEDKALELRGGRARVPHHRVDVQRGSDELGQDGRLRPARREIREEARMVPVCRRRHEDVVQISQEVYERLPFLRRRHRQLVRHPAPRARARGTRRRAPGNRRPSRARRRRPAESRSPAQHSLDVPPHALVPGQRNVRDLRRRR